MEGDEDEGRIGIDLWMPAERWSAVKGLRWMDSVTDAIGAVARKCLGCKLRWYGVDENVSNG
jgi:hypothetical protein